MTNRLLFGLILLWLTSPVQAEQYAFLVGVRDYSLNNELTSLKFTEDDVHTLASTLFKSGVPQENIILMTQRMAVSKARFSPRSDQIRKEFALLLSELTADDSIIVGFSGHGLQFKGDPVHYFCPLDAKPDDKSTLISLPDVYESLNRSKAQTKLLLVDACRDDPLSEVAKSAKRIELQQVSDRAPPVLAGGTIAIFSCSASQQSFESSDLKSGVFFHFVNRALAGEADGDGDKVVDLIELEFFTIKSVQKWARVNLGKPQIPERFGRAVGAMELVRLDRGAKPSEPMPTPPQQEEMPKSITNSIRMKLNLIPAGAFMMGSKLSAKEVNQRYPGGEESHFEREHPRHQVTISRPFYIGVHEVTVGQFRRFVEATNHRTDAEKDGKGGFGIDLATGVWSPDPKYTWRNPGFSQQDSDPVVNVSWFDAAAFCQWLSREEGRMYRLPTEAEWEYAVRAGSDSEFHFGDTADELTKYDNVADGTIDGKYNWSFPNAVTTKDGYVTASPVGSFRGNTLGLHDMHGNVSEWCADWYSEYLEVALTDPVGPVKGSHRVVRGGNWSFPAVNCRSATRSKGPPLGRFHDMGYRVVCVVP